MKLLLVGSDKIYAIENFYVRYLREQGLEVLHCPIQSLFYDYYQSSFLNKIVFKFGGSSIYRSLNEKFKNDVEQFAPDVIWVFKGMELHPKTLQWAKTKGCSLVNYNPDNPFIFSGKGSGNENVTKSVGLYDLHFTYNLEIKRELETRFPNIPVKVLPFGFDIPEEVYAESIQIEEQLRVCFLGNPDKFRARFIQRLAEAGVQIDVYGNSWDRYIDHVNVQVYRPIYGKEVWRVLRRYRIQLNLMRMHNLDSHNMRTFELAGIGGIQLAPETVDHRHYFIPGKEIFLFNDIDTCLAEIDHLLNLTVKEAEEIRDRVRQKSMVHGFSYEARAIEVLRELRSLALQQ